MRNLVVLLGLAALVVAPSISFANLPLEMPPILAGRKCGSTLMNNSTCKYCCNGTTCSSTICGCNPCNSCDPTCTNPCTPCSSCCGTTCMINSTSCTFCCSNTCSTTSCPEPAPAGGLNDTGITAKVGTSGQEDADFGRDANTTTNSDSDGSKGFSFTKLDSNGVPLTNQSLTYAQQQWACVKDNVTGLIWEIRANPPKRPWYNSDSATNGGNPGEENGGANTQTYAASANLCGASSGWRLPTIKELLSIANNSKINSAVEKNYFPGIDPAASQFFWSATPYAADSTRAWAVNFDKGYTFRGYSKNQLDSISVILVRK